MKKRLAIKFVYGIAGVLIFVGFVFGSLGIMVLSIFPIDIAYKTGGLFQVMAFISILVTGFVILILIQRYEAKEKDKAINNKEIEK